MGVVLPASLGGAGVDDPCGPGREEVDGPYCSRLRKRSSAALLVPAAGATAAGTDVVAVVND